MKSQKGEIHDDEEGEKGEINPSITKHHTLARKTQLPAIHEVDGS